MDPKRHTLAPLQMEALILIIPNHQRCVPPNRRLCLLIQRASEVISGWSTRRPQMLAHLRRLKMLKKVGIHIVKSMERLPPQLNKIQLFDGMLIGTTYVRTTNKNFPDGSILPKGRRVRTGITKSVSRTWPSVFRNTQATSWGQH